MLKLSKASLFKIVGGATLVGAFSLGVYVQLVSIVPDVYTQKEILKKVNTVEHQGSVIGENTISAYIFTLDTILNKFGGYTANDLLVKAGLFDNMPSFERGVVSQAREMSYAMRDQFSRSNSNDTTNVFLKEVHPAINFSDDQWNPLANSEGSYNDSMKYAKFYLDGVIDQSDKENMFYTRSVSLEKYFEKVSQKLGDLSQLLSSSRGDLREDTALANDPSAKESTENYSSVVYAKTSWSEVDDVFWEARGQTWALIHYLRAIEVDFERVLNDKNAMPTLKQIIRELEKTQQPTLSPMILNGEGFGMTANYSLTMANYISRAKSTVQELQRVLDNG